MFKYAKSTRFKIFVAIFFVLVFALLIFIKLPLSQVSLEGDGKEYIVYQNEQHKILKVKSGKNIITVTGPRIYKEIAITNLPFITKVIKLTEEDNNISTEEIINSLLNSVNIPDNKLDLCRSFEDNWLVCRGGLGSTESLAAHYENDSWKLITSRNDIGPQEVKSYFISIISQSKAEGSNVIER